MPGAKRCGHYRVAIIDAKEPRRFATSAFDGRASAITAASRRMLEALGVWEAIAPNAQPINRIIVTDAAPGSELRPALLQFGAGQEAGEPSAYMIENRHLYDALFAAVRRLPTHFSISRHAGSRLTNSARAWRALGTDDGKILMLRPCGGR